jgi:hypothetical protein
MATEDENKKLVEAPVAKVDVQGEKAPKISMTEMVERLSPNKPDDAAKIAADEKRRKREELFAGIGDGISALANLYFTSKGAPNMNLSSDKTSMAKTVNDRWAKIAAQKAQKAKDYFEQYYKAQQADREQANADRNYDFQAGRAKAADDQWQKTFDQNQNQFNWTKDFKERELTANQESAKADHDLKRYISDTSNAVEREKLNATKENNRAVNQIRSAVATQKLYGPDVAIAGPGNKQYVIPANVWRHSYQQMYQMLSEDENLKKIPQFKADLRKVKDKPKEMETFVKAYWAQSPAAVKHMEQMQQWSDTNTDILRSNSLSEAEQKWSSYAVTPSQSKTDDDFESEKD